MQLIPGKSQQQTNDTNLSDSLPRGANRLPASHPPLPSSSSSGIHHFSASSSFGDDSSSVSSSAQSSMIGICQSDCSRILLDGMGAKNLVGQTSSSTQKWSCINMYVLVLPRMLSSSAPPSSFRVASFIKIKQRPSEKEQQNELAGLRMDRKEQERSWLKQVAKITFSSRDI